MATRLFGSWTVVMRAANATAEQRVIITGSDGMDGEHLGDIMTTFDVTGTEWELDMEWRTEASSPWKPSVVRTSARFDVADGLMIILEGDDGDVASRDYDYDDLVVSLRCNDPIVDPLAGEPVLRFYYTTEQLHGADD
jgi:hypothetical protein